jgi:uncharacterized membrane protein required for colicin V production
MSTTPSASRLQTLMGALALVSAAAIVAVWLFLIQPSTASESTSAPSPPAVHVGLPSVTKHEFYRRELAPLLEQAKAKNRASADKSLDRLHQEFDRFRSGIPGFVDDVSSWRTRFGIMRRLSRDKWENLWRSTEDPASEELRNYMLQKFEHHILAQDELQKAVGSTLNEFKDDVTANRNRLLADMKVALTTTDMNLDFARPDFASFQREFDRFIAQQVETKATDSLVNATVNLLANSIAGIAAEQVVAQIIVRFVAAQAMAAGVEAAAAGGSTTAGGATLGGAAGWLGGPLGAVVGVGAGLAVGAVVDWWVTDKFKAKLTDELTTYLDNLERDMISGVAATAEQPARIGLREALHNAADKFYDIQSQAALNAL